MSAPPRDGLSTDDRFRAVYEAHARTVRRVLHRLAAPRDLDDLVQITWLKVYERMGSLREDGAAKTWVCRIAVNVARDRWRARKRASWLRFLGWEEAPEAPDPSPAADDRLASSERVRRALAALSPKLRETLVLFSIDQLEIREIATILEIPEGTVKSRLNQARGKLRLLLEGAEP